MGPATPFRRERRRMILAGIREHVRRGRISPALGAALTYALWRMNRERA